MDNLVKTSGEADNEVGVEKGWKKLVSAFTLVVLSVSLSESEYSISLNGVLIGDNLQTQRINNHRHEYIIF